MVLKIKALAVLETALKESKNPYVLSSFGKDSLAALSLAARCGVRKVLYLEDRDEIVDEDHIQRTVEKYQLEVTRMNSGRALLYFIDDQPFLLGLPFVNRTTMMPIPTNLDPYKAGEAFTCVDDRLSADHGACLDLDTDLLISGFKLADWEDNTCRTFVDRLSGSTKETYLSQYRHVMELAPGVKLVSPLLTWSHADVWDYLDAEGIVASPLMYDGRSRRPHANRACVRCHDPALPGKVLCPKTGKEITNLGHFTRDSDLRLIALARAVRMDDNAGVYRKG